MKIVQNINTTLIAEEGKILRKKNTQYLTPEVMLGYDYYEADLPRSAPYLETPDDYEEIDKPEDWEGGFKINQPKRMEQMVAIINTERIEFNNRGLTTEQALAVQDIAPRWDIEVKVGMALDEGYMFTYLGELYRVIKAHTVMSHYEPSPNTEGLYEKVKE